MPIVIPPAHDFRFERYDESELRACGPALRSHMLANYDDIEKLRGATILWTALIMGWFKDAAPNGVSAYHRTAYGEFMLDLIHATWSPADSWKVAVGKPCRLRLAMECEWGKSASHASTTEEVLKDATKIAVVRADAKVMVFGSCNREHRLEIVELLRDLRTNADDSSPWLWLDAPWWVEDRIWTPEYGVLT
jgi:hypothetical protein